MYNEELKQKFISWYSDNEFTRRSCVAVFNACERYERGWGADLCTRQTSDAQEVLNHVVGLREEHRKLRYTILRAYTRWCVEVGVDGAINCMEDADFTGVGKMLTQSVRNPLHLQRYLDVIYDKESEKTTENIYRGFHWLAYAGMKEDDIVSVKTSDVNLRDMLIRFNGSEYPVYREALLCLRVCVEQKQFLYKHPNYSTDTECWKPRYPSDYLLRGIRSDPKLRQLRMELSRRAKIAYDEGKTETRLSYFRVWISGIFYRKYEQELAGIPVDFTDVAWAAMQGKTYSLESGKNTVEAYMRKIRKQYITDYTNWKKTLTL